MRRFGVICLALMSLMQGCSKNSDLQSEWRFSSEGVGEHVASFAVVADNSERRQYQHRSSMPLAANSPNVKSVSEHPNTPRLRAGDIAFDALFAKAVDDMMARENSSLDDIVQNTGNGLAWLAPDSVRQSLLAQTVRFPDGLVVNEIVVGRDGRHLPRDQWWPHSASHVQWALPAVSLLNQLPPSERVEFAADVLEVMRYTLENDRLASFDVAIGLYVGRQNFHDSASADPSSAGLLTNVLYYLALNDVSELAAEAGVHGVAARYSNWANALQSAISTRFLQDIDVESAWRAWALAQLSGGDQLDYETLLQKAALDTSASAHAVLGYVIEHLFGVQPSGDNLYLDPSLTASFQQRFLAGSTTLELQNLRWQGRTLNIKLIVPDEAQSSPDMAYRMSEVRLNGAVVGSPIPLAQLAMVNTLEVSLKATPLVDTRVYAANEAVSIERDGESIFEDFYSVADIHVATSSAVTIDTFGPVLKAWGEPEDKMSFRRIAIPAGRWGLAFRYRHDGTDDLALKWMRLLNDSGEVLAQRAVTFMPTGEEPESSAPFEVMLERAGTYTIELQDFFNASYLQRDEAPRTVKDERTNRMDLYGLSVGFKRE